MVDMDMLLTQWWLWMFIGAFIQWAGPAIIFRWRRGKVDVAELSFIVDTSGIKAATKALEKLESTAARVNGLGIPMEAGEKAE